MKRYEWILMLLVLCVAASCYVGAVMLAKLLPEPPPNTVYHCYLQLERLHAMESCLTDTECGCTGDCLTLIED